MANDLFNSFSKQITNNMIKNNPMINMVNLIRNGGNANSMIQLLSQQNPQMANELNQIINSGKQPKEIISSMLQNKTPMEISNMKNTMINMGVPKEEIDKYL